MASLLLTNGQVLTPHELLPEGEVLFTNGLIAAVRKTGAVTIPSNVEVVDVQGKFIGPGFIDIHVHGGGGYDTMDGTLQSVLGLGRFHAAGGTTTILPTTLTASTESIMAAIEAVEEAMVENDPGGARIFGIHLEGPYVAKSQIGAQNPDHARSPDPQEYEMFFQHAHTIRRMTVAPELPGALRLGEELRQRGIVASIGHSDATFDDVMEAVRSGYSHVTHMYSAMSTIRREKAYRVPGVVEAALLLNNLTVELIADGHHLPIPLIQLILKCKELHGISVITDAIAAAGVTAGPDLLGGVPIIVEDGVAKLSDRSAFAGSLATMGRCVRTLLDVGLSFQAAVTLATVSPARVLGVSNYLGALTEGYMGDAVVFDDEINIALTVVGGRIVIDRRNLLEL